MDGFADSLKRTGISRFIEHFAATMPDVHLKHLDFEAIGPGREVEIQGDRVINFGSDSFLGLDRDPRVIAALHRGVDTWGSHSGASRAFAGVKTNTEAEERIAQWLGTEAAVIFPSVTLANLGAIPGLVDKRDFIAVDEHAHNSIQDGVRLAKGAGVRAGTFAHDDVADLERLLKESRPYRYAMVAVDGVYSMSGTLPPLREIDAVCRENNAILYVDDAHGTGVMGPEGIGVVRELLGSYDNTLVIGSLSKGFSCMGGFVGGTAAMVRQLKIRANTFIFGGPVAPCYCDAIITVLDILESAEYETLIGKLHANLKHLVDGASGLGYHVLGGLTPIVSLVIGDEEDTLLAGKFLFDRGYYVQSVTFPAVPYHAGVLRVQINANHETTQISGLLGALKELAQLGQVRRAA
ncbi:MAG: aminotransferase class I/II-fold pyridoxal phosphate-dependent enzyme [Gemmataceae bacterium]